MSKRLLIIEDDLALRTGLIDSLELEGFDVTAASDGKSAGEALFARHFDLVVLDLMIPPPTGLELLKDMRGRGIAAPVIILTARGDESDRVLGLELGADDYVTKPFSVRELVARVRAHLRRQGRSLTSSRAPDRFRIGDNEVDLEAYELRRGDLCHALSPKEAKMLSLLYSEAGRVVSRERFLTEVWGTSNFVGNRTIDTHMLNLRKKLEAEPTRPRHLLTVHGAGYKLILEE